MNCSLADDINKCPFYINQLCTNENKCSFQVSNTKQNETANYVREERWYTKYYKK